MRLMMRYIVPVVVLALLGPQANAAVPDSAPKTTLEKIRAKGFVQCGTALRPGLAMADSQGHWSGLNFEICRAVAVAVFGPSAHFAIHDYVAPKDYDPLRAGEDDVAFLSFGEIEGEKLTGTVFPGLPVFIETHDILVAGNSPAHRLDDLTGMLVCVDNTSPVEASLEAWAAETKVKISTGPFSEFGEMYDSYDAQKCKAVAGESTALAAHAIGRSAAGLKSRLLPGHLATVPIVIATPLKADSQWAAIVSWTLRTLMVADAKETTYRPDGVRALDIDGPALGLAKDWQKQVIAVTGSYAAIFDRVLGKNSPLKLDPGLNAPALDGQILWSFPAGRLKKPD